MRAIETLVQKATQQKTVPKETLHLVATKETLLPRKDFLNQKAMATIRRQKNGLAIKEIGQVFK
jgi:hypothetical protein